MNNEVAPLTAESLHLIAVHDRATYHDLSAKIQLHVDAVVKLLRETQTKFGRCVVVYWDDGGPRPLIMSEAGCPIDVGWEVDPSFKGDGSTILPVATPSGKVATATHIGPYDQVGKAHQAIVKWCIEHQQKIAGPNWEVYDHPRPGEPPRVDVVYLIG
jgi:effector-binding domain-containing protein